MVVGINFHKFVRVARVDGLPLVPSDGGGGDRRRCGFPVAKRGLSNYAGLRRWRADCCWPGLTHDRPGLVRLAIALSGQGYVWLASHNPRSRWLLARGRLACWPVVRGVGEAGRVRGSPDRGTQRLGVVAKLA